MYGEWDVTGSGMLRGVGLTSRNPLGYKRQAIMKPDIYHLLCSARTSAASKVSAGRYANWYWRVTYEVAGVTFNEERERE
jgi:hypothetical protein